MFLQVTVERVSRLVDVQHRDELINDHKDRDVGDHNGTTFVYDSATHTSDTSRGHSVGRVPHKVAPHIVPHRCRDQVKEDGLREVDPFAVAIACVAEVLHAVTARNKKDKKGGKTPERPELLGVHWWVEDKGDPGAPKPQLRRRSPRTSPCTSQKLQFHHGYRPHPA